MDRALIRNLASMFGWQAANYLMPLVTLPYLARVLDVQAFGQLNLAIAIVAYCLLLSDWGFNLSATREISRYRDAAEKVSSIFWSTIAAKTCLGLISLVLLGAVVAAFPTLRTIWPVLLAAWLAVPASILTANWFLQGMEKMGSFAVASILGRAATVPLVLLLVRSPSDVWIAAALQGVGGMAGAVVSLLIVRRMKVIARPRISLADVKAQISSGWHLFLSTAAVSLYTTTNTVALGVMAGPIAVGLFSGADKIKTAAQGAISPISQAVFPRISRIMHHDQDQGLRFARWLLLAQGGITLVISLSLFLLADRLVSVVMGPGYEDAVPVLRWLACLPFIVSLSNVLGVQILLSLGHNRLFSRILLSAAPLSLGLIGPLVWTMGAEGAAVTAVIVEVFVTVTMAGAIAWLKIPVLAFKRVSHETL